MTTQWVHRAEIPNHVWSYDFVFDQTEDGRQLKCLIFVDKFVRLGIAIRIGLSLTACDVTRILEELFRQHGRPASIRSDNERELVATHVQKWLQKKHVGTHYIGPGRPWQNAYNQNFNSIFRITYLDRCLFSSLTEARVLINYWLEEYNAVRPNGSLGGMNSEQFLQRWSEANLNQQPKSVTG